MLNVPTHSRSLTFLDPDPFLAGEHARPLRIVVDERTVHGDADADLLFAFSRREGVDVYSTDPARDKHVAPRETDGHPDTIGVDWITPEVEDRRALMAAASWEESARLSATELGMDESEAWRVLVLAQACVRFGADALVIDSPVLQAPRWQRFAREARVTAPSGALAVLGLYLRAHNDTVITVHGTQSTFLGQERLYRAAAIATLPAFDRWLEAAVARWRTTHEGEAFTLVRGLEARLGRSLLARDYFNVRLRHPHPGEVLTEILFFFESLLVSLSGALDAAARVCSLAYLPERGLHEAGFARRGWRERIQKATNDLDALLDDHSYLRAIVQLVGHVRNFVHEGVLSEELHGSDGTGPMTMGYGKGALAVREDVAAKMLAAAERAGGAEHWGIQPQFDATALVLPAKYVPAVFHAVPAVLREIMAATDVSRLGGPSPLPFDADYWLVDRRYAREALLLTGLTSR